MFSMLSTQISYKYHIYSQCSLWEIPINRNFTFEITMYVHNFLFNLILGRIFSSPYYWISCYHVKYKDFSSILYLDTFQFTFMLNFMLLLLSTQILVQSYTWNYFHSIFLRNLMFTILSIQISFKYHIYVHCSL